MATCARLPRIVIRVSIRAVDGVRAKSMKARPGAVCMYVCIYIYIYIYIHTYTHVYVYVYVCMYTRICICICMYHTYIRMYVYTYICMFVCIKVPAWRATCGVHCAATAGAIARAPGKYDLNNI
jgi:hypothetical protein